MRFCTILLLILSNYMVNLKNTDYTIDITNIKQCHGYIYPLTVNHISLKIINKRLVVAGSLTTNEDLLSPLKASVLVEKDELGFWLDVPCIGKIGSCTYEDLCEFGITANKTCPKLFKDNLVPCRCPIPQGTYTILPIINFPTGPYFRYNPVVTGKYWANISIEHYGHTLSCYEVYFNIKQKHNIKIYKYDLII